MRRKGIKIKKMRLGKYGFWPRKRKKGSKLNSENHL